MTRSYGGGPERQKKKQPDLREGADWDQELDSPARYTDEESQIQPVRVDFGKRLVAIIIDIFSAYLIGLVIGMIPFVNDVISLPLAITTFLLIRDYLFEGRGIGKNLMGLQVVDVRNGHPCSLLQSIRRNIILFGPLLVLYIVLAVMRLVGMFMPAGTIPVIANAISQIINTICTVYTLIVLPYEGYRVYNRSDGRRLGDQFASTSVVEAPMDFSTPLPRR